MVTLKKDMIHVYDRFEQETGERILNGSLKAGDCNWHHFFKLAISVSA